MELAFRDVAPYILVVCKRFGEKTVLSSSGMRTTIYILNKCSIFLKIFHHTKLQDSLLSGITVTSTTDVRKATISLSLIVENWHLGRRGALNCMTSVQNVAKTGQLTLMH
jgi:hypothetical protein